MEKLKMIIVSENTVTNEMGGCGRNHPQMCGARECSFTGNVKEG